jgi:tight adherence protein C
MNLSDILPAGISPDVAILLLAGIAAGLTAFAVWQSFLVRDPLGPRLKALAERRAALKAGLTAGPKRRERLQDRTKSKKSVGLMRQVVQRFDLLRSKQARNTVMRLARAGYRSKDAPIVFAFAKAILPILLGALVAILIYVVKIHEMKSLYKILTTFGAIGLGFYGPDIWIRNGASRRIQAMRKALPDAIDLMVICAEAGLGMDAAFNRVSREMGKSSPEITDEFGLTSIELSFLPERRQALENLAERSGMAEVRAIVNTLMQTEKYGTPLANSLRVLSAEFRNERLMKAEEKAARLPAILTVPMILFILPPLFIILLGPAIFRIIDAFSHIQR